MLVYVDIDNTICTTIGVNYKDSHPIKENILKINKLYEEGNTIHYWTARGSKTKIDWSTLTKKQLKEWGCKYHTFSSGEKPPYDLLICDKTKRIEEI